MNRSMKLLNVGTLAVMAVGGPAVVYGSTAQLAAGAATAPRATQYLPNCDSAAYRASPEKPQALAEKSVTVDRQAGFRVVELPSPAGGSPGLTTTLPPAGFDATKATPAQLRFLGLPPKPQPAAAAAQWTAMVKGAASKIPTMCVDEHASSLPQSSLAQTGRAMTGASSSNGYLGNWAGDELYGSTYQEILGTFYEAKTVAGCTDPKASLSTWMGFGGDGTYGTGSRLIQMGAVTNTGASTVSPFYELITPTSDTHEVKMVGLINAKDKVDVILQYYPSGISGVTSYPTTAFWMTDETSTSTWHFNVNSTNAYDGRTVEAIDERHVYNGTITALKKQAFNGIATGTYWTSLYAGVSTTLNQWRTYSTHREINMTQHGTSSSALLESSTPVASTSDSTLNAWVACGSPGV